MEKIRNLWRTTVDELLNKVTWPTWDELVESTIIVLVASIIFALGIYIIDTGFDFILTTIFELFS